MQKKEQSMSKTEIDENGVKYEVFETEEMFPALKDPEIVKKFNYLELQEKEALNSLFFFMERQKNKGELIKLKDWAVAEELTDNVARIRDEKLKTLIGR
jgi:hypothetical protein